MSTIGFTITSFFYVSLLLLAVSHPDGPIGRFFSMRPLIALGAIAYGLYLFHEPVKDLLHWGINGHSARLASWGDAGIDVLAFAITVGLAHVSWLRFEKPLVRRGHRYSYWPSSGAVPSAPAVARRVSVSDTSVRLAARVPRAEASRSESPLRVLLLGPYPPPWGGVQTNLVALRDFLRRNGITCAVVNLTRYQRVDDDDVYYPRTGIDVVRLLLRFRYEVIHIHIGGDLSTRLLLLGLVCSALPWAKVVLTFHSGGYPRSVDGQRARRFSFRDFVLRRFDRQIAVNQELVDFFRRVGCAPDGVRLIPPHAVPAGTLVDLTSADLPPELARFVATHDPLIVSISGLEPEYDIPLQLEALGSVREQSPNAGLFVVGSGSLVEELRALSSSKPYGEHILLTGDLPHAIALSAVARSDLSLRTTHYDGDAISVREALWLGTPVIATDNGMRPDGVRLVPVGDVDALTDAMLEQLAMPRGAPTDTAVAASRPTGNENLDATLLLYRELVR
jgi:glycosyltransferase involved in cell wall biosynthesis